MKTIIRQFRASEYKSWKTLWDTYYEDGKEPWPLSRITRKVWNAMRDPKSGFKTYGIWWKGELAGLITIQSIFTPHAAKPYLYISDLYVLEPFRQHRLGTKLLEKVFKTDGPKHCHIEWKTRERNVVARRLYKKYAKKTNWIIYERSVKH